MSEVFEWQHYRQLELPIDLDLYTDLEISAQAKLSAIKTAFGKDIVKDPSLIDKHIRLLNVS